MALFRDLDTIASNSGFQGRIGYALQVAAIAALAEDPSTANHGARRAYAVKVLTGQASLFSAALAVLTNATIAAEAVVATTPDYSIPDTDLQYAINTIFDSLAAV